MANKRQIEQMERGAQEYARAEKSDPFAFNRAMSHIRSGVASIDGDKELFYSADPYAEQRALPNGETYNVTAYRNIARP